MTEFNKKTVIAVLGGAVLVAGGITASAALLSRSSLNLRKTSQFSTEKTIKVKGVAEKSIISDIGAFQISVSCTSADIPNGYKEINRLNDVVSQKFAELQIAPQDVQNETISHDAKYKDVPVKDANNKIIMRRVFSHYEFVRSYRIVSRSVRNLEKASLKLYDLAGKNIDLSISRVDYFISDPEQYKLELVDAATKSAYQRAKTVADTCGAKLGPLLIGRQGVIQITRPASNDTSDYGTYDTTSIDKVMRLVMTLEFSLQ